MDDNTKKQGLSGKYEVGLMVISIAIIVALVAGLTMFPVQGKQIAANAMYLITNTFGSTIQIFTVGVLLFLIALCFTKYGDIRLGNEKPQYKTVSWVAMMFFCGNGAGTVYWAFLEWGYHFNAAPQLNGVEISEAMAYELSIAYTFFDWGPSAWALLCVFVIPFAYHYHIKKDSNLKFSQIFKYSVGEKRVQGVFGKVVDFIFIFAAVGSISITAGTSASTIAAAIADLFGISTSFTLIVIVLLGVAIIYSLSSLMGIEKGMRRISDWNIYFCMALLGIIFIFGPTQYIIDSIVNALGILGTEYGRMSTWTDPVARSGYPQAWTTFYLIYWFVFGPFTGLFVAKISKGRKIKEVIVNMIVSGSAGLIMFFGVIGSYQQSLRINGVLDIPNMLATGQSEQIAQATINTLPFGKVCMVLYLIVIILFLATTLDACSFTLSSTVSKNIKGDDEPNQKLKFVWCIILVALPIAISYVGTDIDTIKSIVLITGLPLVVLLLIVYYGVIKEVRRDFGKKTRLEIIEEGAFVDEIEE